MLGNFFLGIVYLLGTMLRLPDGRQSDNLKLSFVSAAEFVLLEQRFPNWWVASRFVMDREKFLKCDFFII
jgi:hypothetical protein